MLVGIVSDTHGHVHNTMNAVRMLQSMEVDMVIHCGDIGSTEIPALFAEWPTHFVFGNVDRDRWGLESAIREAGLHSHGAFGELEIDGRKVAFLHSDDQALFRKTINSGDWDLVCYGHTHQAKHEQIGPTHVLNPGAIYRANPHSIAVVRFPDIEVIPTVI